MRIPSLLKIEKQAAALRDARWKGMPEDWQQLYDQKVNDYWLDRRKPRPNDKEEKDAFYHMLRGKLQEIRLMEAKRSCVFREPYIVELQILTVARNAKMRLKQKKALDLSRGKL